MKKKMILAAAVILCLGLFSTSILNAQPIDGGKEISNTLFGLFFEDINYAADGGIYAEMVQNRSFEYNPSERNGWNSFSYWEFVSPGFSIGRIYVDTGEPIHPNNPTYVVLDVELVGDYPEYEGESGVGLINHGFDGMVVRAGEKYNVSLFARLMNTYPMDFHVSLNDTNGEVLAESDIRVSSDEWDTYTSTLTAAADSDSASLRILVQNKGKVALDMISLFPMNTFKNRPNGLRADLAQKLADMQPRFLRFPGGCLVHGGGLDNMYRWKNTIGPIEQRKGQRNIWGYHQTAGLGFFEYFQFSDDIGAIPIPILPAGVSCQNSGGTHVIGGAGQQALCLSDMEDYIQEVLDLIEWANGPVSTKWGARRAEAGRSEPFGLKYIGIGNEDKLTPEFTKRFTMIYNAVKEKYPEIVVIGTSGPFSDGEDFDKGWALANSLDLPIVDEHYYKDPEWFLENHYRYDHYDRSASKVYLGEYASWGNTLYNALVEATYMAALERNGDHVVMASYAPLLAKKDFTQWQTNLIFFDNVNRVPTPNFHVQKMFMANQGDIYFDDVISIENRERIHAASTVMDRESGDIILKMVNAGDSDKTMMVDLSRFRYGNAVASKSVLQGCPQAENTFEKPDNIVPEETIIEVEGIFEYIAPPMSLTVIRVQK